MNSYETNMERQTKNRREYRIKKAKRKIHYKKTRINNEGRKGIK